MQFRRRLSELARLIFRASLGYGERLGKDKPLLTSSAIDSVGTKCAIAEDGVTELGSCISVLRSY